MKKFILFLFLLTSVSLHNAHAQDIGDEFTDINLDAGDAKSSSEPAPPGFKSSSDVTSETLPGNTTVEINPNTDLNTQPSVSNGTEFQAQPLALEETQSDRSGDVVLEQQTDLTQSYKKRRGVHGVLFSVNYEKFYPVDYYSQYRDAFIEKILGDSEGLSLVNIELGYKLNFKLGSIAILGNYAQGSKSNSNYTDSTSASKFERNLSVSRYGLSANFALDNILEEPWIVPYGQVGIHQFQVSEDAVRPSDSTVPDTGPQETTTQFAFNYRFGLLFQLNWIEKSIDPATQIDGLRSSGLQNTFIDVYAMTHMASNETYDPADPNSKGDPDMSTGMEFGVGLKMEF